MGRKWGETYSAEEEVKTIFQEPVSQAEHLAQGSQAAQSGKRELNKVGSSTVDSDAPKSEKLHYIVQKKKGNY